MIEIISAKVGLNKVFLRAQKTLNDLKELSPHKKELIQKQEDSLNELAEVQVVLHRLDLKCMSMSGDLYRSNKLLLELQTEVKDLKKMNKKLLENATL
tara:strand:+ start:561 stop:854 length:294 start_codon:yes stop_codon:yes gene_type:complete